MVGTNNFSDYINKFRKMQHTIIAINAAVTANLAIQFKMFHKMVLM